MLKKGRKVPSKTTLLHNIIDIICLQICKFYGQNGSIIAFSLKSKKLKFLNTCLPVSRYSTVLLNLTVHGEGEASRDLLERLVCSAHVTEAVLCICQSNWTFWIVCLAEQLAEGGMSRVDGLRVPRRQTVSYWDMLEIEPVSNRGYGSQKYFHLNLKQ